MRASIARYCPRTPRAAILGIIIAALGAAVVLCASLLVPGEAIAAGPDAVLTPVGYDANTVPRGDDTSNLVVNLPFTMNWFGTTYDQIYINMNGNCTFGSAFSGYNPGTSTLSGTNRNIMAPLWADVDTRNTSTAQVTYSSTSPGAIPQVDGRNAFFVNWIGVSRYNNQSTPTNSFQLVIVDRSDTGAGNFDFMFNYDEVAWDIATSASTRRARAGWARAGSGYELPGSGTASTSLSTLLDTSASSTSLIQNTMNADGQLGRYVWQVRSGGAPNVPPTVTVVDRVLEGNAPMSYTGYTGAGDATAEDPDGTIASLTHDRPEVLPLGETWVHWTATDDRGISVTAEQLIVVQDTAPPSQPTVTCPTHTVGVWSANDIVGVEWSRSVDVCSGLEGYAYSWTRDAAGVPETVIVATEEPVTVDTQSFDTNVWPAGWSRSSTTYVRLTNAAGRTQGTYAAEMWANSNTRRSYSFYRDYDLSGLTSATLSFWNNIAGFAGTGDYARVEYSVDGGSTYTQLMNVTATTPWAQRQYDLPVGGTVRVRFLASVNRTAEYVNWDDIVVIGEAQPTTLTTQLTDGSWYFNVRSGDAAGNLSAVSTVGPIRIDRNAPTTTDNAPPGWSNTAVNVTLTADDGGGIVSASYYRINGGIIRTYTGPIAITAEGTTALQYWSVDQAGNTESPHDATVRLDFTAPSTPVLLSASETGTSTAEITWAASVDALSGTDHYAVVRDGSVIATTTELAYTDSDLEAGGTYVYAVEAVDVAGNRSARSASGTVTLPSSEIWLTISDDALDLGAVDPGDSVAPGASLQAIVGGIGPIAYDFFCSALDLTADTGAPGPSVMPVGALSFTVSGAVDIDETPFTNAPWLIDTATGAASTWERTYDMELLLEAPWDFEPGTYTTVLTYTAVVK